MPGDVDLAGSRVYVFVGKTGLGHDHAVIGKLVSGSVRLDAAEDAGQLVFDMRSFLAELPSPAAGNPAAPSATPPAGRLPPEKRVPAAIGGPK
jgi:hypothetical protein